MDLHKTYLTHKIEFENRLKAFHSVWQKGSDEDIFAEFCYCLLTPREKAATAFKAVEALRNSNALVKSGENKIDSILKENGIALHPQKAHKIFINRKLYYPDTKRRLTNKYLCFNDIFLSRAELAKNIAGFGYKEASHFLRNLGFGASLCILDTHMLRQLVEFEIIAEKPASLTPRRYLEIESAVTSFTKKKRIPLDVLDLIFMYRENPEIMK
jgi:N-glycosylase/DNA lyase